MASQKYEIDMSKGPVFRQILTFAVPLIFSGILQLLYNAADIVIVGRYTGSEALAAVGSTGALINLITNMFIGVSIGSSVVLARSYGAKNFKSVSRVLHTSIGLSIFFGVFVGFAGSFLAKPLLKMMDTPDDVINLSVLYMRIYFCGMPGFMIYNFGSAALRAVGDTKRPLYFLLFSGLINVLLNLFFVIKLGMGVAGVALATIISQLISAALILRCLLITDDCYKLFLRKIRIYKIELINMIKIGLPAGIQGSIFSISNIVIQSAVNSFGSDFMAGNAAAGNLEGFIYISMNSVYQAAITFTSQNYGAKNYQRIKKGIISCLIFVTAVGLFMGLTMQFFGNELLGIYSEKENVIAVGLNRMKIIFSLYFVCGLMEVLVGGLRGLGASWTPMFVSIIGACGIRILWIYTAFAKHRTAFTLYMCYPVSWAVTAAAHAVFLVIIIFKLKKTYFFNGNEDGEPSHKNTEALV